MNLFNKSLLNPPNINELEICGFGPRYGESILLHLPYVGWGVIDSCEVKINKQTFILPLQYLLETFENKELPELAFVILTHPHEDHYKGLNKIMIDYPGDIKRICRYNGVGIRELQEYLIRQNIGHNEQLPGLIEVFKAFGIAKGKGSQERFLSELTDVFEYKNIEVEGFGRTDIILKALSPSSGSATKYTEMLFNVIPKNGEPLKFVNDTAHNLISVSLLLMIGDLQILFAGDLENYSSEEIGWKSLLRNEDCPNLWTNLVKVAHHGSKSGFNDSAWEAHQSKSKPISFITPFVKGNTDLPESSDIDRIKQVSSKVGITGKPKYSTKMEKYYSRKEVLALNRKVRSIKILEPIEKVGFLRSRFTLDGTMTECHAEPSAFWC